MSDQLRLGIIGCDTSHCVEFTSRLNDPAHPGHVPGAQVVIAHPSMSPDMPWSRDRAAGFVRDLQEKYGVYITASMDELLAGCDSVLLCSLDGRLHPAQARPVMEARKPVFVDKPVAASLADSIALYRLADQLGTPVFSSSAIRWYPSIIDLAQADVGTLRSAISYGPSPLEPSHPDLFFYGIHPTEALFTILGPGCRSVQRTTTKDTSVVIGEWADGKVGTLHVLHRWPAEYKVIKFGDDRIAEQSGNGDYTPLVRQIVKFFQTGIPPVTAAQTLEIYAFMEAADESKRRGGTPVVLADLIS